MLFLKTTEIITFTGKAWTHMEIGLQIYCLLAQGNLISSCSQQMNITKFILIGWNKEYLDVNKYLETSKDRYV